MLLAMMLCFVSDQTLSTVCVAREVKKVATEEDNLYKIPEHMRVCLHMKCYIHTYICT